MIEIVLGVIAVILFVIFICLISAGSAIEVALNDVARAIREHNETIKKKTF